MAPRPLPPGPLDGPFISVEPSYSPAVRKARVEGIQWILVLFVLQSRLLKKWMTFSCNCFAMFLELVFCLLHYCSSCSMLRAPVLGQNSPVAVRSIFSAQNHHDRPSLPSLPSPPPDAAGLHTAPLCSWLALRRPPV